MTTTERNAILNQFEGQGNSTRFDNGEQGFAATVTQTKRGFLVEVIDTDSGEKLPLGRMFQHEARALDYARKCAICG
jgi:hypothetical protein